jgi:hypothetical protein
LFGTSAISAHTIEQGEKWKKKKCQSKFCTNKAAVEATAELDELLVLLRGSPVLVHLDGVDAELLASVQGVEHLAGGQGSLPRQTELGLERRVRHVQLGRLENRRLGSNGVVMLIDQLLLVDGGAVQSAVGENGDTSSLQISDNQLVGRIGVGVRLDENESAVLERHWNTNGAMASPRLAAQGEGAGSTQPHNIPGQIGSRSSHITALWRRK